MNIVPELPILRITALTLILASAAAQADDAGSVLDGLHRLLAPGGLLILTTPNASGLLNGFAAMAGGDVFGKIVFTR